MTTSIHAHSKSPAPWATSHRAGGASITMLILAFVACIVVGSLLNLSANDIRLTRISLDQQRAFVAAEAGVDYGVMQMRNMIKVYRLDPQVAQSDLQDSINMIPAPPPPSSVYVYASPTGTAFMISVDSAITTGVFTAGNHVGMNGMYQLFTVTCGASNPVTGMTAVLRDHIQAISLYVVRFGVFYQNPLEIQPGGTMTFRGPVHCNSTIYLGGPLTFYDKITCADNVYVRRLDDGTTLPEPKIMDSHSNVVSMLVSGPNTSESSYMDGSNANWTAQSLVMWQGQILTVGHGVSQLAPPIDPLSSPHAIIEQSIPPPATGTTNPLYNSTTEAAKFSNLAALRIHVLSNGTVKVTDIFSNNIIRSSILVTNTITFTNMVVLKTNGTWSGTTPYTNLQLYAKNADGSYIMTKTGMIGVGQSFYDCREETNMAPVDIYLDQLFLNFPDLYQSYTSTQGQSTVYVTRDNPTGNAAQPCVRIRNASNLLTPITLATDLPLYIEGNFNSTNNFGLSSQPTAMAADAITMLSANWQDAKSTGDQNTRTPVNTTYNLVMLSGNNTTIHGTYNGGLENELRFLENWNSNTVKFRGSIIDLWNSQISDGTWGLTNSPPSKVQTYVYGVPQLRDWGYDTIYQYANPPSMTAVFGMEEILWERVDWKNSGL